jgi:ribosomal protein S18 acetylase RimI-like enzyme
VIRPAVAADRPAVWALLEPVIRAGETYALDRDLDEAGALAVWFGPGREVFVAEWERAVAGTYYLRANQAGGGRHVANAGYVTGVAVTRRGVARAMCRDSLDRARARGFRAMQFNFVVSTNTRAVALWQAMGFAIVGRLPQAFAHPAHGFVDALVMHRPL